MAENSKIEWTHHTFNPWRGCTKVSPGCQHCYAETMSKRNPAVLGSWGPDGNRVIASESYWRQPLKWNRAAASAGERRRVFCASLADVFEDRPELVAPRVRLFHLISETPHLDWLLLTKRPENWRRMWPLEKVPGHVSQNEDDGLRWKAFPNVWLGVSVEDQQRADERIPHLLKTPAAVRLLSCEPLLGPMDLTAWLGERCPVCSGKGTHCDPCSWSGWLTEPEWNEDDGTGIGWVIVGGESGPGARPCRVDWVRSLVRQCKDAGTSCFVKQLGANIRGLVRNGIDHDQVAAVLGSTYRLRDSKGGDPSEWSEDLRVREFPR